MTQIIKLKFFATPKVRFLTADRCLGRETIFLISALHQLCLASAMNSHSPKSLI
jgi:hypothetical protein